MTLEELQKVYNSLKECDPDVEVFNWGPTWEFARQRKEALKLLRKEMKRLKNE